MATTALASDLQLTTNMFDLVYRQWLLERVIIIIKFYSYIAMLLQVQY